MTIRLAVVYLLLVALATTAVPCQLLAAGNEDGRRPPAGQPLSESEEKEGSFEKTELEGGDEVSFLAVNLSGKLSDSHYWLSGEQHNLAARCSALRSANLSRAPPAAC